MAGIKETKEAVLGLLEVAQILAKVAKDGVQLADVPVLVVELQKPEVQAKLVAAQEGLDQVKAEVADLDVAEALELVLAVAPELLKLAQELKK